MALKYVPAKKWGNVGVVEYRNKEVMGEWVPCTALPGHRSPREKVSFGSGCWVFGGLQHRANVDSQGWFSCCLS